eukprot:Hpha_TRINITY_DN27441_c0_g1::TRINITY_DN27441_c0_g1_i1::g.193797::m.193797
MSGTGGRRKIPKDAPPKEDKGWGSWAAGGVGSALKKTGQMVGVVQQDKGRRHASELPGWTPPDAEEQEMGEYGGGQSTGAGGDMSLRTFTGHKSSIYACCFAPGQARFLSGGRDRVIKLWYLPEFGESKMTEFESHPGFVLAADFAATKKHIISGSEDGNIYMYDAKEGKVCATLKGHSHKVYAVNYLPFTSHSPATQIVSGSLDKTVRVWDSDTQKQISKLHGHGDNIFAAQYSRSGELIATAGDDLRVICWDQRSRKPAFDLKGHRRTIWNVSWAPDDSQLVSCGMGAECRVWDARQRRAMYTAVECHHNTPTHQAMFIHGTQQVVTIGRDKLVQVRQNREGLPVLYELQGHNATVYHMDMHPDGEHLLTSSVDCTLKLWKLRDLIPDGAVAAAFDSVAAEVDKQE